MAPLQNTAIESPDKIFEIELVVFGTITHAAVKRTVKVLAQTVKGAKRICKFRYRRSEIRNAREVDNVYDGLTLPLFDNSRPEHGTGRSPAN